MGTSKIRIFAFEYFGSELWFKVKTVGVQDHSIKHLAPKYFVACFHIGENGII